MDKYWEYLIIIVHMVGITTVIAFAVYVTQSAWPLLAMAFVGISVKSKSTTEKE